MMSSKLNAHLSLAKAYFTKTPWTSQSKILRMSHFIFDIMKQTFDLNYYLLNKNKVKDVNSLLYGVKNVE